MRSNQKKGVRTFRRVRTRLPIILRPDGNGASIPKMAKTLDLSFLGMRIHADMALKIGQKVEVIRLTGSFGAVPARVAWVGSKGSDLEGQLGLLYTDPLHARLPQR